MIGATRWSTDASPQTVSSNNYLSYVMKKIPLLLIYSFSFLLNLESYSQDGSKNFIDQNYIEVNGVAELELSPNEIYINAILSEKDVKGKENIDELEARMFVQLQSLGIDIEKQVVLRDLASNFQFYFLVGADVSAIKSYQILVHDSTLAGKVLRNLSNAGLTTLSIDRVSHSELEKKALNVKEKAIKNAKIKAQLLASALEQNVGRAIYIKELDDVDFNNMLEGKAAGVQIRIRGASSIYGNRTETPSIEFENIRLKSSITVRFSLE